MKAKQSQRFLNNDVGSITLAFVSHLTSLPSHSEEERFLFSPALLFKVFLSYAGKIKADD